LADYALLYSEKLSANYIILLPWFFLAGINIAGKPGKFVPLVKSVFYKPSLRNFC